MKTYIATNSVNNLVKIGVSATPEKRVKTLGGSFNFVKGTLHFFVEGNHEKLLHNHFKEFRREGEWFEMGVPKKEDITQIITRHTEENKEENEVIVNELYTHGTTLTEFKTLKEFLLKLIELEVCIKLLTFEEGFLLKFIFNKANKEGEIEVKDDFFAELSQLLAIPKRQYTESFNNIVRLNRIIPSKLGIDYYKINFTWFMSEKDLFANFKYQLNFGYTLSEEDIHLLNQKP